MADPLNGVHITRPVRVPVGVEQNAGFDKAYRQRMLTSKVQELIHNALIKKKIEEGDVISAAKLLSTPHSIVTLRVFFSGMSTSNFCRLDNKEYIAMLKGKLLVHICEPRGNTARCLCGYSVNNLLNPDTLIREGALSVLTNHVGVCPQVSFRTASLQAP